MRLSIAKKFPPLFKAAVGGKVEEWQIRVDGPTPEGYGVIVTTYGHTDGKKQTTEDAVKTGKNAGRVNATTPLEQAVAEAASKWKIKQSRKGYDLDATGAASAVKRSLLPMLAQTYESRAKHVDWETAFGQPKLDGFRCLIREEEGKLVAYSREGLRLIVPHVLEALESATGDVTLDGEIYCHGLKLNKISSLCKKLQDDTRKLKLHLYDAVMPLPYAKRYEFLRDVIKKVGMSGGAVDLVKTVKVRTDADLRQFEVDCIECGYEGAMLRFGREGYEAGKRSPHLLKVKRANDGEFEIIDWKLGRGRYEGVPIFMCQTIEGHTFDVTCHGTLEEKQSIGKNAAAYVSSSEKSSFLKVKFFGFTATDEPVPFQPVSLGFVDDLTI